MTAPLRAVLAALVVLAVAATAHAGSTEPELAVAEASPQVEDGVVTLALRGNWDYGNWVRLGYPIAVVVTQGTTVGRLAFQGGVSLATNGDPPAALPGAPGVVAVAADRVRAVLPPAFGASGTATVRLEADFDGGTLASNAVEIAW